MCKAYSLIVVTIPTRKSVSVSNGITSFHWYGKGLTLWYTLYILFGHGNRLLLLWVITNLFSNNYLYKIEIFKPEIQRNQRIKFGLKDILQHYKKRSSDDLKNNPMFMFSLVQKRFQMMRFLTNDYRKRYVKIFYTTEIFSEIHLLSCHFI